MLSGAKHLQCLLQKNQMQILHFALDDNPSDFFRSVPGSKLKTDH